MRSSRLPVLRLAACLAALLAAGCGDDSARAGNGTEPLPAPLQVVVTVPPQAYLVERIAGERAAIEVMMPSGSSEETWSPSPRQMVALTRADLYVLVGHPALAVERRHVLPTLAESPGVTVVDMSRGMDLGPDRVGDPEGDEHDGHEHAGGAGDPHVWTSPRLMRSAAVTVAEALARRDPEGADAYRSRLAAFLAELDALDAEIRRELASPTRRRFLVTHPAWGHFAADYGLEQVAIDREGKEPSPARLVALVEVARAEGLPVVFSQRGFPESAARVIARETGARVVTLDPIARDWLDNTRKTAREIAAALL